MVNTKNVSLFMSKADKATLKKVAARLQRSQSDTIRVVLREKLAELEQQDRRTAAATELQETSRPN